ncbi:DNA starvation/stationary phase protection protein, partial [Mycoplasmopsis pullorum]
LEKLLDFVSKLKSVDFRVQPVLDEVVLFCHEWAWKFKKASK